MAGYQTSENIYQQVDVCLNETSTLNLGLSLFQMCSDKIFVLTHIQLKLSIDISTDMCFVYSVAIILGEQGNAQQKLKKEKKHNKQNKQWFTETKSSNLQQLDHILRLRIIPKQTQTNLFKLEENQLWSIMTKIHAGINTVLAVASFKLLKASRKSRGEEKNQIRGYCHHKCFVVIYNRHFSGYVSILRAVCKPVSRRIGDMSSMDQLSHLICLLPSAFIMTMCSINACTRLKMNGKKTQW